VLALRGMKFYSVGAGGIVVQAAVLTLLVRAAEMHYLPATALAVEAAILHNCAWHIRWTWAERRLRRARDAARALLRFNLTVGAVSIGGNLAFMRLLAGTAGIDPVVANLLSIACCSLVNFLVSDRFAFAAPQPGADDCGPTTLRAAGPAPAAAAAARFEPEPAGVALGNRPLTP
jgi:putative flippase GtrA